MSMLRCLASATFAGAICLPVADSVSAETSISPRVAPSFNCAHAKLPTEKAICSDSDLAELDAQIGQLYSARRTSDPGLLKDQRRWIGYRNAVCEANTRCIEASMLDRLKRYQTEKLVRSAEMPSRVGDCETVVVLRIGNRLADEAGHDDPDSGSEIQYTAGSQVSYDAVPGIDASKIGDLVRVCLKSIPKDCPPGDDRGREYSAVSLRTGLKWVAADSEHECGGA